MLIEEKMREIYYIYITISGSGSFCVPKCENEQYKVENGIQSNTGIVFFRFL